MRRTYSGAIAINTVRSVGQARGSGTELLMMAWLRRLLRRRDEPIWTELQVAPDVARIQTENDLKRYLDAGLPPQGVTWTVRAPTGVPVDGPFKPDHYRY